MELFDKREKKFLVKNWRDRKFYTETKTEGSGANHSEKGLRLLRY